METASVWQRRTHLAVGCCACVLQLCAASFSAADEGAAHRLQSLAKDRIQLAQGRQCKRSVGPFTTQDTAWQHLRQARSRGQSVSDGVVPCRDQYGTRGYCFYLFDC